MVQTQRQTTQLTGTVQRIVYQSTESGLTILHVKVWGNPNPVTVVGAAEPLSVGESIEGYGAWQKRVVHDDMLFNCYRLKRLTI